ncbi:MAG: O-antigen ligase family protein, partial [Terriglobales bacterium]
ASIGLGATFAVYFLYGHLQYFGNVSFLGGILLLEVIIASLWKYEQRFFVLLIVTFTWAGLKVPLQGSWAEGRWVVLGAGAVAGFIVWTKTPRGSSSAIDLLAFFCVCAAFVSASVSTFVGMASLKALSLMLLFLYCVSGGRLAARGREKRFFEGLIWGGEIAVFLTAGCYFGLGTSVWGNPNSLGAVMSVAVFPILLWGWFTADGHEVKVRRLVSLFVCAGLVVFSMARAGMIAMALVTILFCVCLKQYRVLMKLAAICLVTVAVTGTFAPRVLNQSLGDIGDALLYKGHKEEGLLGSRKTPWEQSMASIKQHPWFGTGYGTSPSGEDPGFGSATPFSSTAETARENGSSYVTIAEWVGLLGVLPFVMLLAAMISDVWKVFAWMKRTADPRHYSIPLAMVVLAGLIHANFEDWLFAVGYHLTVYFWVCAFLLADIVSRSAVVPVPGAIPRASFPPPCNLGAVVPNR